MSDEAPTSVPIEARIHTVRGQRAMLDADLAEVYGVTTKRLLQQMRRNAKRFPEDFAFQLTGEEFTDMRPQITTSSSSAYGGRRYRPFVFTEHGAIMLASVLNSPRAVEMSIFVVRAFARLRALAANHRELASRLAELERRVGGHDQALKVLVVVLQQLTEPPLPVESPRPRIGFSIGDKGLRS